MSAEVGSFELNQAPGASHALGRPRMIDEWQVCENKDNGSLRTGTWKLAEGDVVEIAGEARNRSVTSVMGSEKKGWYATFAGQGAVPLGQVRWRTAQPGRSSLVASEGAVPRSDSLGEKGTGRFDEAPEIQVAKITAKQGMIGAVITAVSGILVGLLTGYQSAKPETHPSVRQHWITLKPIFAEPVSEGLAVRIVVLADSQAFSYPSRAVWSDIGPSMSEESFPLPLETSDYRLRFEAFLRLADGEVISYTSQEVDEVEVANLKGARALEYPIFPLDRDFARGAYPYGSGRRPRLKIAYEIR